MKYLLTATKLNHNYIKVILCINIFYRAYKQYLIYLEAFYLYGNFRDPTFNIMYSTSVNLVKLIYIHFTIFIFLIYLRQYICNHFSIKLFDSFQKHQPVTCTEVQFCRQTLDGEIKKRHMHLERQIFSLNTKIGALMMIISTLLTL